MIVLIGLLCVLFGVGIYFLLLKTGIVPGEQEREYERQYSSTHVPHLRELPQGCLIALIAVGTVWFGLWMVVLVLALNFFRAPFK